MARELNADEQREFLSHGTRTAKLATTMRDGSPHVMPVSRAAIWRGIRGLATRSEAS